MARSSKRTARGAQKQQAAAFKLAGLGLVMVLLPYFLGRSTLAVMLRPLAPLGWLLLVAGVGMFVVMRRSAKSLPSVSPGTPFSVSQRAPKQPATPPPLVERRDPVGSPDIEPARPVRVRPTSWSPAVFTAIEWRRFEAVVETLFAQAGFITRAQSHGPDEGIDVWLYSKNQPDGAPVSVVQCKHWQGKAVGVDKVRELRGVMAAKGVMRGQFATTSSFTPDATAFAQGSGIKLHDGAGLLQVIGKRTPEQQQALLEVALEGEYWKPTCASCGIKMIEREPAAGGKPFWGCVNYPKCRNTMAKRAVATI